MNTSTHQTSFQAGVIWNMASLAFLAAAGFVLNIVIGRLYGPEDLGLFNICFGLFIFLSQFGSFGLQFSVLHAIAAREAHEQHEVDEIVSAGFVSVLATSTIVAILGLMATPLFVALFNAPNIASAWIIMLPGLWAFSINKYLFGVLNGARHMRIFAVLQSLRYALMLVALGVMALNKMPGYALTGVFTVAELLLLPLLAVFGSRTMRSVHLPKNRVWVEQQLSYGSRAFLSGAILELNTRVDVLLIGAWLDATRAGIYSAALLVVEGISQAVFAFRNNVNPLIAKFIATNDKVGLLTFSRKLALYFTAFMIVVSVAAILIYPLYVDIALGGGAFHASLSSAVILLTGLAATAGAQCFGMILAMAGKPGLHTAYVAAVMIANVALNALLIPLMGIEGSATATALSYVVAGAGAILFARGTLGLRIIT